MDKAAVLTKAIEKAVANGWEDGTIFSWIKEEYEAIVNWLLIRNQYRVLIFDHKFAKALVGGRWAEYLRNAVVEEDPLAELEKWL